MKKKKIRFFFPDNFLFWFCDKMFNIFEQACFRNDPEWKLCPSNGEDINLHSCIKYII